MEFKNPLNQKKQTFEEMVNEKTIGKWTPKGRPELKAGDEVFPVKVAAEEELTPEEAELESEEIVQEAEEPEPEVEPDNAIDYTGKYLAFVLTPESRQEILNNFVPKYKKIDCHHITVVYNITDSNKHLIQDLKDAKLDVIGYQFGPKVDCVAVEVNGDRRRINGSSYHVTLSLKRGGNPNESNDILRQQGIQEVIPFAIQGELTLLDKNAN